MQSEPVKAGAYRQENENALAKARTVQRISRYMSRVRDEVARVYES